MDARLAHRQRQERRQQAQQHQVQLSEEIQAQNDVRVQRAREEREQQNRALIQESIARTQETEQVGEQTLDKLKQQGQQMNRIADDLDETDETLNRTDAILDRMSRWFCFSLCCGPSEEDLKNQQGSGDVAASGRRAKLHTANGDKTKAATGSDNIDDDLDVLGSNLKRIGGLADTMGEAVDDQTEMAGHINRRTDDVDEKFHKQNQKMDKLLR